MNFRGTCHGGRGREKCRQQRKDSGGRNGGRGGGRGGGECEEVGLVGMEIVLGNLRGSEGSRGGEAVAGKKASLDARKNKLFDCATRHDSNTGATSPMAELLANLHMIARGSSVTQACRSTSQASFLQTDALGWR